MIPRSLANGLSLALLCDGVVEKGRALFLNGAYAIARLAHGKTRPFEATVRIAGISLTLDWSAAEHIPIREVLIRREYAPSEEWLPQRSETVVDVGANAGVFAMDAARRVGRAGLVIAVEPNPAPLARLRRNALANGFEDRVRVVAAALGSRDGKGVLVTAGSNTTIGHLEMDAVQGGAEVPVTTLDRLVDELHLRNVDLLKVDVEGGELAVLVGGSHTLKVTHRVVLEVEDEPTRSRVVDILQQAGFTSVHWSTAGPDSGATLVFAWRS